GVTERGEAPERPAAVAAPTVFERDTRERAAGLVVAGRVGTRSAVEAARVAVDDVGVDLAQRFLVALQPRERVTAHVRVHDVGAFHESVQDAEPLWRLQVDADAALAAVGAVGDVAGMPPRVAPRVHLD